MIRLNPNHMHNVCITCAYDVHALCITLGG